VSARIEPGEYVLMLLLLILLSAAIYPAPINKVVEHITSALNMYGSHGD